MGEDFLTVVFQCAKDSKLREEIMSSFKNGQMGEDGVIFKDGLIKAISMEDVISRVENFENEWPSTRLAEQKKEASVHELSKMISSLFSQIETEIEFIEAVSNEIPSDAASLLWHSLTDFHETEQILR